MQNDGGVLRFCKTGVCSPSFARDLELVELAVRNNGSHFADAADSLKSDRATVLRMVKISGWALLKASKELSADREARL